MWKYPTHSLSLLIVWKESPYLLKKQEIALQLICHGEEMAKNGKFPWVFLTGIKTAQLAPRTKVCCSFLMSLRLTWITTRNEQYSTFYANTRTSIFRF